MGAVKSLHVLDLGQASLGITSDFPRGFAEFDSLHLVHFYTSARFNKTGAFDHSANLPSGCIIAQSAGYVFVVLSVVNDIKVLRRDNKICAGIWSDSKDLRWAYILIPTSLDRTKYEILRLGLFYIVAAADVYIVFQARYVMESSQATDRVAGSGRFEPTAMDFNRPKTACRAFNLTGCFRLVAVIRLDRCTHKRPIAMPPTARPLQRWITSPKKCIS